MFEHRLSHRLALYDGFRTFGTMVVVLPLLGRIAMSRFSPPERHTRDIRPPVQHAVSEKEGAERPPFRRIAILASVPGLSRPAGDGQPRTPAGVTT
jgi:hypothetical protein